MKSTLFTIALILTIVSTSSLITPIEVQKKELAKKIDTLDCSSIKKPYYDSQAYRSLGKIAKYIYTGNGKLKIDSLVIDE